MSKDQKTYELIDAFLDDELKVEDSDKVKYRIRNDGEFALQVELQSALREEIKVAREKDLRALLAQEGKVKYIKNMWSTPWLRASAAVIIGFVGLFFVIKYFMPEEARPLVENQATEKASDKDTEIISKDIDTAVYIPLSDSSVANEGDSLSIDEIASEEEEIVDEDVAPKTNQTSKDADDFSDLRERSEKLKVEDDVEVKTDKLLLAKNIYILVLDAPAANREAGTLDEETTAESASSKLSRKERKRLKKAAEKKESSEATENKATDSAPMSKQQNIEFWEGVVNSQGYMWDSQTLLLYGIKPSESLSFKQYQGRLYMRRGATYYAINKSAKFEPYKVVTNSETLKILQ